MRLKPKVAIARKYRLCRLRNSGPDKRKPGVVADGLSAAVVVGQGHLIEGFSVDSENDLLQQFGNLMA
jgi:hypothetical protein